MASTFRWLRSATELPGVERSRNALFAKSKGTFMLGGFDFAQPPNYRLRSATGLPPARRSLVRKTKQWLTSSLFQNTFNMFLILCLILLLPIRYPFPHNFLRSNTNNLRDIEQSLLSPDYYACIPTFPV